MVFSTSLYLPHGTSHVVAGEGWPLNLRKSSKLQVSSQNNENPGLHADVQSWDHAQHHKGSAHSTGVIGQGRRDVFHFQALCCVSRRRKMPFNGASFPSGSRGLSPRSLYYRLEP